MKKLSAEKNGGPTPAQSEQKDELPTKSNPDRINLFAPNDLNPAESKPQTISDAIPSDDVISDELPTKSEPAEMVLIAPGVVKPDESNSGEKSLIETVSTEPKRKPKRGNKATNPVDDSETESGSIAKRYKMRGMK